MTNNVTIICLYKVGCEKGCIIQFLLTGYLFLHRSLTFMEGHGNIHVQVPVLNGIDVLGH